MTERRPLTEIDAALVEARRIVADEDEWSNYKKVARALLSTAKEADRMRKALQRMRDYAWCALEQFKDRRGHLDISGFHSLIEVADAALLPSEGTKR